MPLSNWLFVAALILGIFSFALHAIIIVFKMLKLESPFLNAMFLIREFFYVFIIPLLVAAAVAGYLKIGQ